MQVNLFGRLQKCVMSIAFCVGCICLSGRTWAKTPRDYVQDGLIAVWDAYENDGAGGHATELTEWKDTSGTYSFVFTTGSGITVDGGALVFPGTQKGYATLNASDTDATFELAKNGTCEIVILSEATTGPNCALQSSNQSGILLYARARTAATKPGELLTTTGSSSSSSRKPVPYNWSEGITTFATTYSSALSVNTWANGEVLTASGSDGYGSGAKDATYLGHRASLASGQAFKGKIYAIRLYSERLTPEQIAANREVDVARFINGDFRFARLVVTGEPFEFGEVSPAYGSYAPEEIPTDPYVAPVAYTNDSQTMRGDCLGWKLYDADNKLVDFGEGTSLDYVHPGLDVFRRLAWQWSIEYAVDAVAEGKGSVSAAKTWVSAEGGTIFLTATPDADSTFKYWSDRATGEILGTEQTLELTVDRPRQVAALFASPGHIPWSASISDYEPVISEVLETAEEDAVITFDSGVYPLSSTLEVARRVTLCGAPDGGTVLKASGSGYCVLTVSDGATVERLAVTGGAKTSGWNGTGFGVNISDGTLSQCVITNNSYNGSGNGQGVGVYVNVAADKTVKITRCRICDNLAAATSNIIPGAGLYVTGSGSFRMDNCLVTGNKSTRGSSSGAGGGLYINHKDAQIVNCTFADNVHNNRGGGVNIGGGTPKFTNCIIARNSALNDPCVYAPDVSASTLTDGYIAETITNVCYNNLVSHGVPAFGLGGLSGDPLFAEDGYTLKDGSPAIGVGLAVEGITDGVDLNGVARDPTSVDLGCYKFIRSTAFTLKVDVRSKMAFNDGPVPVSVTYYNAPVGKTLENSYYAVGDTETNQLSCVEGNVVINNPGVWNILVVVREGENVLASERSATSVKVGVHKVFVTSRADATPVSPYETRETAATCLNDVNALCIDGTEIELDAGTHTVSDRNDFTAAVHLHGAGRDRTWINAMGSVLKKGAFYVNNSGFVMENLSVTNYYRTNGGAIELASNGGTVRNCRFAKNELHWAGGNCSGMTILSSGAKALIENCIFEDLSYTAGDNVCCGIALRLEAGTARNCLFANIVLDSTRHSDSSIVAVSAGATLENCTFAGCRIKYFKVGSGDVCTPSVIFADGTVRNVLCCALEEVHAEGEPVPPWRYLAGAEADSVCNCCFEGETTYGIDGADGTKINFDAKKAPYHLHVSSSCRNKGLSQPWMVGATDLDGNPRIFGKAVDIGCYECQTLPGLIIFLK